MELNNNSYKIAVIICAAGSSSRMGKNVKKEYLPLEEGTVLSVCAKQFINSINPDIFAITIPKNDEKNAKNALFFDLSVKSALEQKNKTLLFVEGGKTRQESVFNALCSLQKLTQKPDFVLIHDGARPFVTNQIICDVLSETIKFGAAAPGTTPVDTQKTIDSENFIAEHLNRSSMIAIQTPQGFKFEPLLIAHKKAKNDNKEYTDDTEIWGKYAGKVKIVQGDILNKKITFKSDYKSKNSNGKSNMEKIRTGLGYDLHRLVEGRKLLIGGIEFPFEKGEDGHSDGDALLHAITDALLGASALGDIGSFFPPEEAKWKDANSIELLKTVWQKVKQNGWKLINLDCVVKLEKPKFLPKRNEVIKNIANALEVSEEQVFVKAKTGEKLDSVGSGNAIEAFATCLLYKD